MGQFKSIIDWDKHKLITEDMEKYNQMSIGSNDIRRLLMFYIPEKYRMSMDVTKGMSINELHSACEMCLNKYFGAVQNGIEILPCCTSIVGYSILKGLLFYFVIEFLDKENKFIRASEVKCSYTLTDNHKIEYEVIWPDGGTLLLNSELQFIWQPGNAYRFSQCIHVYDSHYKRTKKGVALFGMQEGRHIVGEYFSIIKTSGEFQQIPIDCFSTKGMIVPLPMIPYGILHNERTLLIENYTGVYAFDIYMGYICHLKDKRLLTINKEDMARIWFENHPIT